MLDKKSKVVRDCPVYPHHGEVEDRRSAAAVFVEVVLLCALGVAALVIKYDIVDV